MVASLAGKRVLVTRAAEQAEPWVAALSSAGARAVSVPLIRFEAPEDWGPVDAALEDVREFDAFLFTSQNALRFFESRAAALGRSPAATGRRALCVGPRTLVAARECGYAAEEVRGLSADAEGMLAALLAERDLTGKKFLMPRAAGGRKILSEGLRRAGAQVEVVTVYRTCPTEGGQEVSRMLEAGEVDVLTFASPSAVKSFVAGLSERGREVAGEVCIAAIGSVTREELQRSGLEPRVVAERPEVRALIEALVEASGEE